MNLPELLKAFPEKYLKSFKANCAVHLKGLIVTTFEGLGIGKSILKALDEIGFISPTPIQEQAIPVIKSGKDVLGIAQTGDR